MQDTLLSPHFTLQELCTSQMAARCGIDNMPLAHQTEHLKRVANMLEEVRHRALRDLPISVSSGFRNLQVNKLVGGSANSDHIDGRAVDFVCSAFGPPKQICQRIIDADVGFDQLIYEGTWVHMSVAKLGEAPRREVLTAVFRTGQPTQYLKGLV